ncbi:MAG: sugar phosphate isomerase/epimerase [Bryobacteraceae bacterium]|nr:sugar phosphate isomerase/epimerase [Bryobacteraceae bacterium]
MMTRRQFAELAVVAATAGSAAHGKINSKVNGVMLGAQSYSFRDRPLDEAIAAMKQIGIGYTELWQGHIEPKRGTPPEELKKWRTSPQALTDMAVVKKKFADAGIQIYALNYSFRKNHTDEEVAHGMKMARALGTKWITASSTVDQAKRLNDLAGKNGVVVAMHNHDNLKDPNEYATPDSFSRAMSGNPNIRINLDIGHFTAANFDPIAYLNQHHDHIVTLHIKDRKKDHGANVVFGEGETPIKPVLQLLKTKKWKIPAMVEYEYKGNDTVAEVKKCFEYMKQALA